MGKEVSRLKALTEKPAEVKPIAPPPQPEKPVIEKPKPKPVQIKEVGGRRWWLVGIGVLMVLVGLAGFVYFVGHPNNFIGMAAIASLFGGCAVVWWGLQNREAGMVITQAGKKVKKVEVNANSLNIYYGNPGVVKFEELSESELLGTPHKCRNNNKYYYVHISDCAYSVKKPEPDCKLIEFNLPDTQYRSPGEFALNLSIPAHRRLAQRKSTLLEKISPIIIVAAIIISGVIWIATTPAPGAPQQTSYPPNTQQQQVGR